MPAPARLVLVVANPAAGLRRGRDAGAAAARAAERRGVRVDLVRTSGPGDARTLGARAAAEGYDLVIAVGGDGTAHEAANGVAGTSAALGIAAAGTMNLLARVLALPLDPAAGADHVAGSTRRIVVRPADAGGRLFLLMAGIGFDAWVLRELLAGVKGKISFGDYVRGALRGVTSYPFPDLTLEHDRGVWTGHSAILGRSPLYGGFLRPTPRVRIERDELELCAFHGGRASFLRLLPELWSGAHLGRASVLSAFVTRLAATSQSPDVPVQLDGEPTGRLPMSFSLSEKRLALAI